MQKKVLLVTPGLCGVCKNLSILLAIRQCGVRNKISELFLLCFLLGAALESLYIGLYKSMYSPWPVSVVPDPPEGHVLANGPR